MNDTQKSIVMSSPALLVRHDSNDRFAYPANFRGRVPLKVRLAKTVTSDLPAFMPGAKVKAEKDSEQYVWVNKHGAVSAVFEDGEKLGLLPQEFDVIEWHEK